MNGNEQLFTKFRFRRVAHSADKIGDISNIWKGQITLVTDEEVINELEAQRDIETLVRAGLLPMFGRDWMLAAIQFVWVLPEDEKLLHGPKVTCLVRLTYRSYVERLGGDEYTQRLNDLQQFLP